MIPFYLFFCKVIHAFAFESEHLYLHQNTDGESIVFPAIEETNKDDGGLREDSSNPRNIKENFNMIPRKIRNKKIMRLIDNYILPGNPEFIGTSGLLQIKQKKSHEKRNDYTRQQKIFQIHRRHKKLKRKSKYMNNYLSKKKNKAHQDSDSFPLNLNFTKKSTPRFVIGRRKRNQRIQYEDPSRYLFNWKEVLILIGVSILFSSSVICCCASIFQSGICEKKSASKGDFKVDKWWANQNTPEALLLLPRSKSFPRENTFCKWSRSSKQKNNSKVVCQCSSSNSSTSIAF
ncbi:uncharacterized protein NPIL_471541 [Nephila pilipes]|uniref:Uncharacterized protein n=1 Tax=Nephila pilipes TaxID=299642 RepID=A0A8X6TPA4_NEPPI|nr:uncharacterized protein NPIL_471541 [Nephila pilipes]